MSKCRITTSKARGKHGLGLTETAERIASELDIPFAERENKGIQYLIHKYDLDCMLVEEDHSLHAVWEDGEQLTHHYGMAAPRIRQISKKQDVTFPEIAAIEEGNRVLDCTMGMASDALVLSFLTGKTGSVTALESSPIIYAVTRYGLEEMAQTVHPLPLRESAGRIQPIFTNYETYLTNCDDNMFDIVYFDPMFEEPIYASSGIAPLRRDANYAPLTETHLQEALRVAKKRVVVKHREGTLKRLSFDARMGGKYSAVAYGILFKK